MLDKTYIFSALGLAATCALIWIWRRPTPQANTSDLSQLVEQIKDNTKAPRPPSPNTVIKRFAKVDEDDYQQYYQTVLNSAAAYLKTVGQEKEISRIYAICSKSLRKRWSTIFHSDDENNHAAESTFWTYSIFCSVILRHVIRTMTQYQFTYQRSVLSPLLYSLADLNKADIKLFSDQNRKGYPASTANIHIIDKVFPPHVVELLITKQSYAYLVNAVTGYYQNKQHPYYSIIEQVEKHVLNIEQPSWFDEVLTQVLQLIENNSVSKNKMHSKVFESVYSLLIDRHLFWEMFKVYQVSDQPVLEKCDFEQKVKDELSLTGDADHYNYEIKLSTGEAETMTFIVSNLIALPYSKINYAYGRRLAAKKIMVEREIVPIIEYFDDENAAVANSATLSEGQDNEDKTLLAELFKK